MKNTCLYSIALACLFSIPLISLPLVPESVAADMYENNANEMIEAAHRAGEAFSKNDLEEYLSYFTDDFTHQSVSRAPADKEQFAQKILKFFNAFPGVKNYQKDLLPYKNYLVFDECTFEIPLPEKNKTIKIFHMDIVEMEGNKLKVKRSYGDGSLMKAALNKIEPPFLKPKTPAIDVPPPKPVNLPPQQAQSEFFHRWNKHDLRSLGEMFDNDAEILVSPLLEPVGRVEYLGWQELFFEAFPDASISVIDTFGGNDWAVSEIHLKGTNSGPYINNISTGKTIDLKAGYLVRFDESGTISSLKFFIDSSTILKQLEIEPVAIN